MIKKILFTFSLISVCAHSAASSFDKTLIYIVGVKNKGSAPVSLKSSLHEYTIAPSQELDLKPVCMVPVFSFSDYPEHREATIRNERYVPAAAARIIINGIKWRLWLNELGIQRVLDAQDEDCKPGDCIPHVILKAQEIFNNSKDRINLRMSVVDNNKLTFERS